MRTLFKSLFRHDVGRLPRRHDQRTEKKRVKEGKRKRLLRGNGDGKKGSRGPMDYCLMGAVRNTGCVTVSQVTSDASRGEGKMYIVHQHPIRGGARTVVVGGFSRSPEEVERGTRSPKRASKTISGATVSVTLLHGQKSRVQVPSRCACKHASEDSIPSSATIVRIVAKRTVLEIATK